MFTKEFYPTPPNLANKMAGKIKAGYYGRILEPSAGKGDLVEALHGDTYNRRNRNIDCIEKSPELQNVLRGKDFTVVGSDFLSFNTAKQYDAIVMNPPFSEGVTHVLKAWQMMYNGDVVAIINAESVKNPHTKERKLLKTIIDDHGTVEFIADAFAVAERKTKVEVALIHLKKRNTIEHDYFDGMRVADAPDVDAPEFKEVALTGGQIKNKVIAYDNALDKKREAIIKTAEAEYYKSMLLNPEDVINPESTSDITDRVKKEVNEFIDELQEKAWGNIITATEFSRIMTSGVQASFESTIQQTAKLEFTEYNIRQFLINLLGNRQKIYDDCILNVFDELTQYYPDNRVHVEGWKSNDYFFINKRVILPHIISKGWGDKVNWHHSYGQKLQDLDKVMAYLAGISMDNRCTIRDAIEMYNQPWGMKLESYFFYIRVYKKGTIHLYFKEPDLLANLNLAVGRLRGWLPKEHEKVPKEFWLMNK